ncbi:MAG: hypothetical protein AB1689_25080 [Thermodesulfobacteriota bacterium]
MIFGRSSRGPRGDLVEHLRRFPEDLRDIRRLQRRFGLSAAEAARALEVWTEQGRGPAELKRLLVH